jgi:hypothetical protein
MFSMYVKSIDLEMQQVLQGKLFYYLQDPSSTTAEAPKLLPDAIDFPW